MTSFIVVSERLNELQDALSNAFAGLDSRQRVDLLRCVLVVLRVIADNQDEKNLLAGMEMRALGWLMKENRS